ncbi:MAG: serine hydrolase [Rhizobiales bacterium]|nr:serine hydrolase [Hyphomicrobiales bacterium]
MIEPSDAALQPHARLAEILNREVAPRADNSRAATKALLVVRDGKLVGEAYAPGFDAMTPIIGYSLAKTLCNAVTGRMVETGHLDVEERDLFAEWRGGADRRRDITIAQLLQMTSGLTIAETHTGYDPVSHMLFLSQDMGTFAARSASGAAPGQHFKYTSGNTLLVSRLIRDRLGGDVHGVLGYLDRELFAPAGMERMLVEFDASGTPILSTFCYASARDWARLGLLFLNDGCVGTTRLLPQGWVEFSKSTTIEPSYGAGLRLSRAGGQGERWLLAGMPEDTFYGHGHLGQYVLVIPSLNAVIVRLGTSAPKMRPRDRAVFADIAAAIGGQ